MSQANETPIESEIYRLDNCEFLQEDQSNFIRALSIGFVKSCHEFFGDNDGDQLEEEGVNFIVQYLKLQLLESVGVEKIDA